MKYDFPGYYLYQYPNGSRIHFTLRVQVNMKEPVDIDVLRSAVNTAIIRYPYLCKKVYVNSDGAYALEDNPLPLVVLPAGSPLPQLCTPEINEHMLFFVCGGNTVDLYISHSLIGGKGAMSWVMTCIYQYVKERFGVEPDAPEIKKPDAPMLPGEYIKPSLGLLPDEEPIYTYRSKGPHLMLMDYINGLFNPLKRNEVFWTFRFRQEDILQYARQNDASVVSLFMVLAAKMLDKLLPSRIKVIGGEIGHNPSQDIGLANNASHFLSHVFLDYTRPMLSWDLEKLGTFTRGQMMLQTDPSVSAVELRRIFSYYEELDGISGLKNKIAYAKKHNPATGRGVVRGTYIVNYSGQVDWGQVSDYVDSYYVICDGHLLMELGSKGDEIYLSVMQLLKKDCYIRAFEEVLKEADISYEMSGPFSKNMVFHKLPEK